MDSHQDSDGIVQQFPELEVQSSLRGTWRRWGDFLRRRHLEGLAAWMLDAGKPLALVSAQFLYMGRPFLGSAAGNLARLLESERETADFVDYLGSARSGGSELRPGKA